MRKAEALPAGRTALGPGPRREHCAAAAAPRGKCHRCSPLAVFKNLAVFKYLCIFFSICFFVYCYLKVHFQKF